MTQPPGAQAPERVRFGDGPAQDIPLNLAESLLREAWKASPERFGNLLKKAMMRTWPMNGKQP